MFCMLAKNRKKYPWLRDPVPAMPLSVASSSDQPSPADDMFSYDHDIPNSAHIEREFGVTQLQRIKAF